MDRAGLSEPETSAILTGVDVVSPIASPEPPALDDNNESSVIPSQPTPFGFQDPQDYFCHRNGLVESAFEECKSLVTPNEDGEMIGIWILTEISFWDTEKERIIILTTRAVIIVKYDFITMKKKEFSRIPLSIVDTLVVGPLVYPPLSVVPRLNGIANGISTVVRDCISDRFSQSNNNTMAGTLKNGEKLRSFDIKHFEARNRNMNGVRLMWNKGEPLPFIKKWNPFDNNIPLTTYSSHPLFWHKSDSNPSTKEIYDIEDFSKKLVNIVETSHYNCKLQEASIMLQNYVGLTSFLHNKTSMGFFKARGNFSF